MLLEGLGRMDGVRIAGMKGIEGRTAVISVDFTGRDNAEAAYLLDKNYGIKTRCGFHPVRSTPRRILR